MVRGVRGSNHRRVFPEYLPSKTHLLKKRLSSSESLKMLQKFLWFCLVAQSCPTLCDRMDRCMPDYPILHYLSEFAQIHVH